MKKADALHCMYRNVRRMATNQGYPDGPLEYAADGRFHWYRFVPTSPLPDGRNQSFDVKAVFSMEAWLILE